MELEQISVLIAFVAAMVAIAGFVSNRSKAAGKQEAHNAEMLTRLSAISEDTKDIKAEQRSLRAEIDNVRTTADHALERANAAHKRLDRSGIDQYTHHEE